MKLGNFIAIQIWDTQNIFQALRRKKQTETKPQAGNWDSKNMFCMSHGEHESTVDFCKNKTKADPEICIYHFENENERKIH